MSFSKALSQSCETVTLNIGKRVDQLFQKEYKILGQYSISQEKISEVHAKERPLLLLKQMQRYGHSMSDFWTRSIYVNLSQTYTVPSSLRSRQPYGDIQISIGTVLYLDSGRIIIGTVYLVILLFGQCTWLDCYWDSVSGYIINGTVYLVGYGAC